MFSLAISEEKWNDEEGLPGSATVVNIDNKWLKSSLALFQLHHTSKIEISRKRALILIIIRNHSCLDNEIAVKYSKVI